MMTHPESFRHLRLELARERGHPEGDASHGYDLVAPLRLDGHLDISAWRANPGACRVRRFRPEEEDAIGHLARKPGGQWYFDYGRGAIDEEPCFRLGEEHFVAGEYVAIREEDGKFHTFKIASIRPL